MRQGQSADVLGQRLGAVALGLLLAATAAAQSTPWYFVVTALNGGNESEFSNVASKNVAPGEPATLRFNPPTVDTEGKPLTALTGYRFYWGSSQGFYPNWETVNDPGISQYTLMSVAGPAPLAPPGPVLNVQVTPVAAGSWSKGFSFRATAGYVTDAPGTTYVLRPVNNGTVERYPTTRNGVTFGWENDVDPRDRSRTPAELAGIHQLPSTWGLTRVGFRVDLPAPGRYRLRWALGDQGYLNRAYADLYDGGDLLLAIPDTAVAAGQFLDATLVARSTANWATQNVAREFTFTTTTLRFYIKRPAATASVISHLSVERL